MFLTKDIPVTIGQATVYLNPETNEACIALDSIHARLTEGDFTYLSEAVKDLRAIKIVA